MTEISRTDMVFKHYGTNQKMSGDQMLFSVEWNSVSPAAVHIPQTEVNKWVEEMVREMIVEEGNLQSRVCGDTIVTVFREDEDKNYFSVEVAKRISVANVIERKGV
jgi:hypothetical protein